MQNLKKLGQLLKGKNVFLEPANDGFNMIFFRLNIAGSDRHKNISGSRPRFLNLITFWTHGLRKGRRGS